MKIVLLGATGFVGSALLKEALDRGHIVTAIARHPETLALRDGSPSRPATSLIRRLSRHSSLDMKRSSAPSILAGGIRISTTTSGAVPPPSSPP